MTRFPISQSSLTRYDLNPESGQGTLLQWQNGEIAISGQSQQYPGLMQVDTESVWIHQNIGNISASIGAIANKYGWYRGLNTQYGLAGSLHYKISPKLSFNIFGTYYLNSTPRLNNGMFLPPSMLGYYDYTRIGGYVNYDVSDQFGVQMGGQVIRRTYSSTYEVEPIATPYIKVGKGKKKIAIGLPVGQILNGLVRR